MLASDFNLVGSSTNDSPFLWLVDFPLTQIGILVKPHPFSTDRLSLDIGGLISSLTFRSFGCLGGSTISLSSSYWGHNPRNVLRFMYWGTQSNDCSHVIIFLIKFIYVQCKISIAWMPSLFCVVIEGVWFLQVIVVLNVVVDIMLSCSLSCAWRITWSIIGMIWHEGWTRLDDDN